MAGDFHKDLLPPDVRAEDTLYVADRALQVVYSNEGWAGFASGNRGTPLLREDWNRNLLENMSGNQKERWRHIYELLLAGRMPHHEEEQNCSSPSERRIYRLRITPIENERKEIVWLVHHLVRIDDRADPVERISSRLERLEDPTQVLRRFREHIVERRVKIPTFELARHFAPLQDTGGDLIWHREYPEGVTDLILADVAGHGSAAGRTATKVSLLLDELASLRLSPGETVAALNRAMLRLAPDDPVGFATGLLFRFAAGSKRATCCSFGHEGPIFSRTGPLRIDNGLPVGMVQETRGWPENDIDLDRHGARFLVFSDGITEQFNVEGEMFDIDGLHAAFNRHLGLPLEQMLRRIVADLETFRGEALVKDDQTLIALQFTGEGGDG
jgi:hypothetical protein